MKSDIRRKRLKRRPKLKRIGGRKRGRTTLIRGMGMVKVEWDLLVDTQVKDSMDSRVCSRDSRLMVRLRMEDRAMEEDHRRRRDMDRRTINNDHSRPLVRANSTSSNNNMVGLLRQVSSSSTSNINKAVRSNSLMAVDRNRNNRTIPLRLNINNPNNLNSDTPTSLPKEVKADRGLSGRTTLFRLHRNNGTSHNRLQCLLLLLRLLKIRNSDICQLSGAAPSAV